jgi:hypothetical protein
MVESFELQNVSGNPQKAEPPAATINLDDADGTVTAWSLATFILFVLHPWSFSCGWLTVRYVRLLVLAGLFVVSPRLLIFIAGESRTILTPLEAFLAFQFGILWFSVSVAVLVNVRMPYNVP